MINVNLEKEYEKIKKEKEGEIVSLEDVQKSIASSLSQAKKDYHECRSNLIRNSIEEKVRTIQNQLGFAYPKYDIEHYSYQDKIYYERMAFDRKNIRLLKSLYTVVVDDNYQDVYSILCFLQDKYRSNLEYFQYSSDQVYFASRGFFYSNGDFIDDHIETVDFIHDKIEKLKNSKKLDKVYQK